MSSYLSSYLAAMQTIRASGANVAETSFYGALEALLNDVGASLSPTVSAVLTMKNQGAGLPDGGIFTADQLQAADSPMSQLPARGAMEVKGLAADVEQITQTSQVKGYLAKYGLVLVTNYRDFLLVSKTEGEIDRFTLAATPTDFWQLAASPSQISALADPFAEALQRMMQSGAPITTPANLAWFLASYARQAMARLEGRQLAKLATLRSTMEAALGITFEGEMGDHFFRSSLVQTLFYGIFSAWVLWCDDPKNDDKEFDWRLTSWLLNVPMIRALFEEVSKASTVKALSLDEILKRAGAALNRVDRDAFFTAFQADEAVQYFYEPFLEQFDPELRKQMGVWYTPPEIVRYMVGRVDQMLREELGVAKGLADENVLVLDPACGTGAYLVEVLRHVAETLGGTDNPLLGAQLKAAATSRVFGFEILPAPFVVAHLQLGLLLQKMGASLAEREERVAVYLTNALTGWKESKQPALPLPEFAEERDAAERIKQQERVLVVLGNPPYNGYAGMAIGEERDLTDAYRNTKHAPKPQGQGLNDLYVRFYRIAERQIVEQTGRGIVCFISNYSWLDGLSFTGMREEFLDRFNEIWIDNLHGDRIISEYAPDGRTSETVFAMQGTSVGIKIGTAIGLLVAEGNKEREGYGTILYRDHDAARADARRVELVDSLAEAALRDSYDVISPIWKIGAPFKPRTVGADYLDWPLLPDLLPTSFPGIKTSRDEALVEIDRSKLMARMEAYFDPQVSNTQITQIAPRLMTDAARFDAEATRAELLKRGMSNGAIVRYCYRPFDLRWLYWEPETKLLDEKRADYFPNVFAGNPFLFTTGRTRKNLIEPPIKTDLLVDLNYMDSGARGFPLRLAPVKRSDMFDVLEPAAPYPNLSAKATAYLDALDAPFESLFYHIVATLHASDYRNENGGALRQDWPRIPLPNDAEALQHSAQLGQRIARLLDPEESVDLTALGTLGRIAHVTGGQLRGSDLALTAKWGYAGRGGITMPARGKSVARRYDGAEHDALARIAESYELSIEQTTALLGEASVDVYLNDVALWRGVPSNVWGYTLGGYQVLKKWLSYREEPLLGRPLTVEEVQYFSAVVQRIAAILLADVALNGSYGRVKGSVVEGRG